MAATIEQIGEVCVKRGADPEMVPLTLALMRRNNLLGRHGKGRYGGHLRHYADVKEAIRILVATAAAPSARRSTEFIKLMEAVPLLGFYEEMWEPSPNGGALHCSKARFLDVDELTAEQGCEAARPRIYASAIEFLTLCLELEANPGERVWVAPEHIQIWDGPTAPITVIDTIWLRAMDSQIRRRFVYGADRQEAGAYLAAETSSIRRSVTIDGPVLTVLARCLLGNEIGDALGRPAVTLPEMTPIAPAMMLRHVSDNGGWKNDV